MEKKLNFDNTVMNYFKEVVSVFDFEVKKVRSDEIQFCNNKCIVRFIYDHGSIECDFIDPKEKIAKQSEIRTDGFPSGFPVYPVQAVWRFLYMNDKVDYSYGGWDIDGQVMAVKKLLLERLVNVLNGDFSWTNDFKINDDRLSKKIEYMTTHWDIDNPVRIKFREGNIDWEKEFDEYRSYLDNL